MGRTRNGSTTAYDYIARRHRDLWIIEANATYSGFFLGGNQAGDLGNRTFVTTHIQGHGALGDYFAAINPELKMGDTPSLTYLFGPAPANPAAGGWGGRFVRAWRRPRYTFTRPPAQSDTIEVYSILEIVCRPATAAPPNADARMVVDNQEFPGFPAANGEWHFLFSTEAGQDLVPTASWVTTRLNGQTGGLHLRVPAGESAARAGLSQLVDRRSGPRPA